MGVRWRRSCLAIFGAVALVALAESCQEHTAIVVDVHAGLRPSELRGVSFTVGVPGTTEDARPTTTTTRAILEGGQTSVGTLVVIPGTSDDAPIAIKVIASVGKPVEACTPSDGYFGCIVARRSLRYSPHTRLHLPILLEPECLNVPCDAVSTCAKGACVSAEASCRGDDCDLTVPGVLGDGGVVTVDAPSGLDASMDADASGTTDASDANDSGNADGGVSGSIRCSTDAGACTSGNVCCTEGASMAICSAAASTCPPPAIRVECDGAEDCPIQAHCCFFGGQSRIACSQTPCMPKTEVCKSDVDCHLAGEHCTNKFALVYGGCQ